MKKTKRTKILIRECWRLNASIPKGYGTRSSDYFPEYERKEKLLYKIVSNIKKHSLKIKYGWNDGVMYFAFDGEQYSFHSWWMGAKKYKGKWIGKKRNV